MVSSRLTRTIRLLNALQSSRPATVDQLASSLRCSRRTVYRDINLLRECGVNVFLDETQGGYTIQEKCPIPMTNIEPDELIALLVAASTSPLAGVDPFHDMVQRGTEKVLADQPNSVQQQVLRLTGSIRVSPDAPTLSPHLFEVLKEVISSMQRRTQLHLVWTRNGTQVTAESTLTPSRLKADQCGWTIQGYDSNSSRVLRIDLRHAISARSAHSTKPQTDKNDTKATSEN